MKISVLGINKNELQSGKNLAEMGNEIIYVCKNDERIADIKRGYYTDSEKEMLKSIKKQKQINFTADLREALHNSSMCFISESNTGGTSELFTILSNAKEVGANMSNHTFIIDRSTLDVNRVHQIKDTVQSELDKRASNLTFEVISDSNFLRA
ncbi:UDP-glucose 6-dehydrogenase [hydrothermal vent metagenome]|uniref:UDP-glucose 6-dehydrogenase n=1 Tax=hydrothermal vent metagenome TaxID=652676 RepID=A0A1W1CE87_9ZZZZ